MSEASKTSSFCKGQRWISETEPELGLGILFSFDPRTITVFFPRFGLLQEIQPGGSAHQTHAVSAGRPDQRRRRNTDDRGKGGGTCRDSDVFSRGKTAF